MKEVHREDSELDSGSFSSLRRVEWAVIHRRTGDFWRGPYDSRKDAEGWIQAAEEDGLTEFFYIARRYVGPWEKETEEET